MNTFLIALGSNLGDRQLYIDRALEAMRTQCGAIVAVAPVLASEPIGAADQAFFNTAAICVSSLGPESMLKALLEIEQNLGRTREVRWGNRTIDCDIILWKAADGSFPSFQSDRLTIPHPETLHRSFVLEPSAAIAGDWLHPQENKTLGELWTRLSPKI